MLEPKLKTQTSYKFKDDNYSFSLQWYEDDPENIILNSLEVKLEYRKQGIGTQILSYAEGFAKAKGFKTILLKIWTINRGNWIHQWFERHGYKFHDEDIFDIWLKKEI